MQKTTVTPYNVSDDMDRSVAPLDRERLSNAQLNSSVAAALIGGFAYTNIQGHEKVIEENFLDMAIYILSVIAVHACTCSCLASAFLYQKLNGLSDADVSIWANSEQLLLKVPLVKFVLGIVLYLLSVILMSWRDLAESTLARYIALAFGIMGIIFVFTTAGYVTFFTPKNNYKRA